MRDLSTWIDHFVRLGTPLSQGGGGGGGVEKLEGPPSVLQPITETLEKHEPCIYDHHHTVSKK